MADEAPGRLSLEEPAAVESLPTSEPEPPAEAAPETEPEGVEEVSPGKRMVPVATLVEERRRVREAAAREVREKELEPLRARADEADRLRAALAEVQPHLQFLRDHPEVMQPKPLPLEEQVTDEEARAEARDYELYTRTGEPDLERARRIIAKRRQEVQSAADQAARAAVGPITSQTADAASRQNFVAMARQTGAGGQPLVDAKLLARMWASVPAELTQHPQVGELLLNAAIGEQARTLGTVAAPARGPTLSEPAGGRSGPGFQHSGLTKAIAQAAGMSEKSFSDTAKQFRPGETNVIGE